VTLVRDFEFSLQTLSQCIREITTPERPPESLLELGDGIVSTLHNSLRTADTDEPIGALVRFFMTVPYGRLHETGRTFIADTFPDAELRPDTKCLTLFGTKGDEDDWCEIVGSRGHQAIPLISEDAVRGIPMIARLVAELGLEISHVLKPGAEAAEDPDPSNFNVFHVENALGSAHIPAQDEFVVPRNIRSVLGFGSLLPTGHLCAVIIFSRATIRRDTAQLFRPLALGVRIAILPLIEEKILAGEEGEFKEVESLRALNRAQEQLLHVFRSAVDEQSSNLDGTMSELQETNSNLRFALDDLSEARAKLVQVKSRLASRFAMEKLREFATYQVALVVGTLINVYGHFLVPYLRGHEDVWGRFTAELQDRPGLGVFSVVLAYLFPVAVQVHSAVRSRLRSHAAELRANFPDNKPDPVFRASLGGEILDAGATTQVAFAVHRIKQAQDVLGDQLWQRVLALQEKGNRLPPKTRIRVEALNTSYFVGHAASHDGSVNIYLTDAGD
jgi:hypothetical protein